MEAEELSSLLNHTLGPVSCVKVDRVKASHDWIWEEWLDQRGQSLQLCRIILSDQITGSMATVVTLGLQ